MTTEAKPMLEQLLDFYRWMVMAREIDILERAYCQRGEAFFTIGGSGHEGSVAVAPHLTDEDWINPHYRDKALILALGVPPIAYFDTLFSKDTSHCRGRQMADFLGDPAYRILPMTVPVGNNALPSVGLASTLKESGRGIGYCGCGGGGTQEGEWMEAVAAAVRDHLPVLFMVQDNQYAISTRTKGKTFFSLPQGPNDQWYGLPIHHLDGTNVESAYHALGPIVAEIRENRGPALVVFHVVRLCDHSNADDQTVYRSEQELAQNQTRDPIFLLELNLNKKGITTETLQSIKDGVIEEIKKAGESSQSNPDPIVDLTVKRPILPTHPKISLQTEISLTMADAIRDTLRTRLRSDQRVILYGEDIEDPKGDVFKVTHGLSMEFPGRVINAPLSEATIIGVSVGRALGGMRPVAFIQFGDFFPLAYNQLYSEVASMYWRTAGKYEVPLILMITCGGYRPGLGPYHAASMEATAAHIPGIDVLLPSNAADAVGLLNSAFDSGRPTIFFYPKNLLHNKELAANVQPAVHRVPLGKARLVRSGHDLTLVAWGNTVPICEKASVFFEKESISLEIIDLRSISPWDEGAVLESAGKTGRLLVVHEDNHTVGFGAEILATVAEKTHHPIQLARLAREDTFIPYHFANQLEVLPSLRRVVEKVASMLKMEVVWEKPVQVDQDIYWVEAIGASPSDETVEIVEWNVKPGDIVVPGAVLAAFEASKAIMDLECPVSGTVEEVLVAVGQPVKLGTSILSIRLQNPAVSKKPVSREDVGLPLFSKHRPPPILDRRIHVLRERRRNLFAGIGSIAYATGSCLVGNPEVLARLPEHTSEELERLTGIVNRPRLAEGETVLTLAVAAAREALSSAKLTIKDINLLICSTGTPLSMCPSLACLILKELSVDEKDVQIPTYDISAACSGYLYGLSNAYDFIYSRPKGQVLLITAECLSKKVDPNDYSTAPLFGDAATATVLMGGDHSAKWKAMLYRPSISAKPDEGNSLTVPLGFEQEPYIQMKGHRVFQEAVRCMMAILKKACHDASLPIEQLDCIVPHQANQRIIDAIRERLGLPEEKVYSNIRHFGNTSSSSIPICLKDILANHQKGERIGLCAFGGGFTFGAGIIELTADTTESTIVQ